MKATLQALKTENDWGINYVFSFKEVLSNCRVGVYDGENVGYISDLVIDVPYRDKGYGTQLLKDVECYMSKLGIIELRLTTDNEHLKQWYEREGYVVNKIEYTLMRTDNKDVIFKRRSSYE